MTSSYIERLIFSCKVSNGFFITSQIVNSNSERKAFFIFRTRNPDFFETIFKGKNASIYRISPKFYFRFGLDSFKKESFSKTDVIKNLTWLSFCFLKNIEKEAPSEGTMIHEKLYYLDDFTDSILNNKDVYIVSLPFRETTIFESGNWPIIPSTLYKNFSEGCLKSYFFGIDISLNDGFFWPKNKEECHSDLRQYPALKQPISGHLKFEMDKELLKNKTKPEGYSFGVYKE